MRAYILAAAAALLLFPTYAFSQEIHIGPGGVGVGPGYHHHRYYNFEGGRCRELRAACMHKEELGEQGMGNCRRYRAMCG
jgi:hypothetical protein